MSGVSITAAPGAWKETLQALCRTWVGAEEDLGKSNQVVSSEHEGRSRPGVCKMFYERESKCLRDSRIECLKTVNVDIDNFPSSLERSRSKYNACKHNCLLVFIKDSGSDNQV